MVRAMHDKYRAQVVRSGGVNGAGPGICHLVGGLEAVGEPILNVDLGSSHVGVWIKLPGKYQNINVDHILHRSCSI